MSEREIMILKRLRQLWAIIQETNPNNPLPVGLGESSYTVQSVIRAQSRKKALEEFQPLFNELIGGERVESINLDPIDWSR